MYSPLCFTNHYRQTYPNLDMKNFIPKHRFLFYFSLSLHGISYESPVNMFNINGRICFTNVLNLAPSTITEQEMSALVEQVQRKIV